MNTSNHNNNMVASVRHLFSRSGPPSLLFAFLFALISAVQAADVDLQLNATAASITKEAGTVVSQTPKGNLGPVYVFEEDHASIRGQIQIATMLTRLYKRDSVQIIGLEGSPKSDKPLPAKTFLPGKNQLARRDALRRMLVDGDIRATEYVGAVNTSVELWGLEKQAEFDVSAPTNAGESQLSAILIISEKLLPQDRLETIAKLMEANKGREALDALKDSDPWIREQLSITNDDLASLQEQIKHEEAILAKAKAVNVALPKNVRDDIAGMIRFYQMAEQRSSTIAVNMESLIKSHPGKPAVLVVGAAHADSIMNYFASKQINAVLLKALDFSSSTNDAGLAAFENRSQGLLANDAPDSLGHLLNGAFGSDSMQRRQHPTKTYIGNPSPSRDALGSIQYATSVIAEAVRAGQNIPNDIPEVFRPLPGQVNVDPTSIWKNGYDVVFSVELTLPGNMKRKIWVRAGTASQAAVNAKDKDLQLLSDADGEPPKDPPADHKSGEHADDESNGSGERGGRDGKPGEPTEAKFHLADIATKYKVFTSEREAKSSPQLSVQ